MVLSVDFYCIVQYRTLMYYVTGASTVDPWTGGCREIFYVAALILLCGCAETIWVFILLCTFRFRQYIICTDLSHATRTILASSRAKYNRHRKSQMLLTRRDSFQTRLRQASLASCE